MDRKKIISILALIMAIVMILGLVLSVLPMAHAIDEDEIEELEQQKEALTARAKEAQSRVDGLREQEANVLEQKLALDEELRASEAAIGILDEQLAIYDHEIAEKAIEVQQARTVEDEQLQRFRRRVRAMEEEGSYSVLFLLIQAENMSELLSAVDDIRDIMASDKALERQYRAAREESERIMGEFEELRDACRKQQERLQEERDEIAQRIEDAEEELAALEIEIENAMEDYKAAQQAEAIAAFQVMQLIEEYLRQKEQEAAQDPGVIPIPTNPPDPGPDPELPDDPQPTPDPSGGDTGEDPVDPTPSEPTPAPDPDNPTPDPTPVPTPPPPQPTPTPTPAPSNGPNFVWPVPCSKRITSRFGYRIDPFTGETRYHSGIDIDGYGNEGNNIIAADGGTVVISGYNDGYGNYVIIDHGNGYMTLYGHMSGSAVTTGSTVSQGQVIGYLGKSGRATGVHCHFEVILNGTRIDPEQFFSGMTYWNC